MSQQPQDLLHFDVYTIDVGQRVLLSRGTPVPLSPKVFDTLLALAEEAERVLEKDYLLQKVWPDTFVEEGSLARNVSTLRRVLGKSPDEQEYIETIPKRGYRFKGTVRRVSREHASPAESDRPPDVLHSGDGHEAGAVVEKATVAPSKQLRVGFVWSLGVLVALACAFAAWRLSSATERPRSINSLAVLPFLNLSADQEGDYFSDGLTEELINALSNIPGLHVVSRTTVFQFKNRAGDVRELGRRMNVDAIMEGSVRRESGRIRVTVQLNNVQNGYHYWSKTWDDEGTDVFAIQQGIAQQVALSLRPSEAGVVIAGRPLTTDLQAYNLYLQGQFHRRRASGASMKTAVEFYRRAIDRDPSFAEAYVGLAILLNEAGTDGRLRPAEAFPQSQAAVTKALELNPQLAAAYSVQGWISMHYDWKWDAAERNLRRAIDLGPTDPETHHSYSHYLLAMGRVRESLAESQRSIDLDPLNAGMRGHLVLHFDFAHEFVRAIDAAKTALDIDPAAPDAWIFGLTAYESSDRFEEAIDARAQLAHPRELIAALRVGLAAAGARGYWTALRDQELQKLENGQASARTLTAAYARLGQEDEAVDWIERAFREREGWLAYLNVSPHFDGLRTNPRFRDIVARIGLPARH
jgi:TolB-like protein/DNA-binding winged helix-turn-helix (wHTH) protein/tetratricopeptide (TPR) repeat protein